MRQVRVLLGRKLLSRPATVKSSCNYSSGEEEKGQTESEDQIQGLLHLPFYCCEPEGSMADGIARQSHRLIGRRRNVKF